MDSLKTIVLITGLSIPTGLICAKLIRAEFKIDKLISSIWEKSLSFFIVMLGYGAAAATTLRNQKTTNPILKQNFDKVANSQVLKALYFLATTVLSTAFFLGNTAYFKKFKPRAKFS